MTSLEHSLNSSGPRSRAFVPVIVNVISAYLFVFCLASVMVACLEALGYRPWPIYGAPSGFFYNPIPQGMVLALACVLFACQQRWGWLVPLLPGLYLAHSRGGWVTLAFGLLSYWFRRPIWLLVLLLAGGVALLWDPSRSDIQRMQIWHAAGTLLTPLGNGFGSFWDLWIGIPAWQPQYAHNDFLELAFEFGFLAVPVFALVAYAASRSASPFWPMLVTYLTLSTYSMPMHIPLAAGLGALALALTLGVRE